MGFNKTHGEIEGEFYFDVMESVEAKTFADRYTSKSAAVGKERF